jgi:hypothetical protein
MRLSWNRDEDGVVTVYATTSDGRCLPVADFWLTPWMQYLGVTRPVALGEQQRLAGQLVSIFNQSFTPASDEHLDGHECPIGDPSCLENCGAYGCKN